jgi:hypothetical protein
MVRSSSFRFVVHHLIITQWGLAMELLAREHQTHLSDVAVGVDRLCYTHCCTVYRPI